MNKREALEICEKGWLELARSGADEKPEMFSELDAQCPCCEYCIHTSCVNCPITWPSGHCNRPGSPYWEWEYAAKTPEARKVCAAQVAALARAELDKMIEESKEAENVDQSE